MSLREEMWRYEKLTGESAEHIPIIKIGAFLDGVDKGIEELEKIKAEIKTNRDEWIKGSDAEWHTYDRCISIIDNYIEELKGE